MKILIKQLLREGLMFEAEVFDFRLKPESNEQLILYNFNVDDLTYIVSFSKIEDNYYELGFGIEGQEPDVRINKGRKHINSVLATVDKIVYDVAKRYHILMLVFGGARNEGKDTQNRFVLPIRTRMYKRYIETHHPSAVFDINRSNAEIVLKLFTVYPELYPRDYRDAIDILDLLLEINTLGPEDRIKDALKFTEYVVGMGTDYVENEERGTIYFNIELSPKFNEYSIEWYDDNGDGESKNFESGEAIYDYIKETFLSEQQQPENQELDNETKLQQITDVISSISSMSNNEIVGLLKPYGDGFKMRTKKIGDKMFYFDITSTENMFHLYIQDEKRGHAEDYNYNSFNELLKGVEDMLKQDEMFSQNFLQKGQ